jgi:uncharacterized RDD family membrane protein YckC
VLHPDVGKLASPARRLAAYFVDLFIPIGAFIVLLGGSLVVRSLGLFLVAIGAYLVWAFTLFANGMTPGKKTMGIYVASEDGRHAGFMTMFVRETFGKFLSGIVFGLGWVWILIDKSRQGWHDKLASTYVVRRP